MEYIYIDEPQKKTIEEYKEVIKDVTNQLISLPDVVSVYQTGAIRALGLSDIDLIFVVKSKLNNPNLISKKIKGYLKEYPYFFQHVPIIIPEEIVDSLNEIYPLFDFKHLAGKNFNLKGNFTSEISTIHFINEVNVGIYSPASDILIGNQINPYKKLFGVLFKNTPKQELKLRYVLGRLSSFKYLNFLCKRITSKPVSGAEVFQAKIDKLRNNWFDLPSLERNNQTISLSKDYLNLCLKSIEQVNTYLSKKQIVSLQGINESKLLLFPRINYYFSNWDINSCYDNMVNIYDRNHVLVNAFPINFLVQPLLAPQSKYFFDASTRNKLRKIKINYKFENKYKSINEKMYFINDFVSKYNLPGKRFTKLYVGTNLNKFKRIIASYLYNERYNYY